MINAFEKKITINHKQCYLLLGIPKNFLNFVNYLKEVIEKHLFRESIIITEVFERKKND